MKKQPGSTLRLVNDPDREPFEITRSELLELVRLVDKLDPIDFSGVPVSEEEYFCRVTEGVMNMLEQMQSDSPKNWTVTLIASLIKTVAENGILEARLVGLHSGQAEAEALLQRLMRGER